MSFLNIHSNRLLKLLLIVLIFISCRNTKEVKRNTELSSNYYDSLLALPKWDYKSFKKMEDYKKVWSLLHQQVSLDVDIPDNKLTGSTIVSVISNRANQYVLELDAVDITIDSISYWETKRYIRFDQDSSTLKLKFDSPIELYDTVHVKIDYQVLDSYKGVYFINSSGNYLDSPTQVYTQNQPNDLRFWLPSLDHPNQRATFELWLNYPSNFESIATGSKLYSKTTSDSTKQDYWTLNIPQSPYLWGFVIGEFSSKRTLLNSIIAEFFVVPEFEDYMNVIYHDVDKMLHFMENYTQIEYPFGNIKFVPVYEFEAAGMENTTMITLFDDAQFDSMAHIDVNNTNLLIHEIAHHWFGNIQTVTSWKDIALQEGLTTWMELKYLKGIETDKYESDKWYKWKSYLGEAQYSRRPLLVDGYNEARDLFDAHSYEKASLIFDLLEKKVGEDVFRKVLQEWLKLDRNQVNIETLIELNERYSGLDLAKFKDQWFLKPGHPQISFSFKTDSITTRLLLKQAQNIKKESIFDLNIPFRLIKNESVFDTTLHLQTIDTTFTINQSVEDIWIDPNFTIPMQINETLDKDAINYRLEQGNSFVKARVLTNSQYNFENTSSKELLKDIIQSDDLDFVKVLAANQLLGVIQPIDIPFFEELLVSNQSGRVRYASIYALLSLNSEKHLDQLKNHLENEESYFIKAEIIKTLLAKKGEEVYPDLKKYLHSNSYQDVLSKSVIQGVWGTQDSTIFYDVIDFTRPPKKSSLVFDALDFLSAFRVQNDFQKNHMIEYLKEKTTDEDISIKIQAFKLLVSMGDQMEWIKNELEAYEEEDRSFLMSVIFQKDREIILEN